MNFGPDEAVYNSQAELVQARGVAGLRSLANRFLDDRAAGSYPSPLRWLWALLNAVALPLGRHAVPWATLALMPLATWFCFDALGLSGLASVTLAVSSPLLWQLSRRALQDPTVALLTLLCIGSAAHGIAVATGAAFFALLALKESGALNALAIAVAWVLSGGDVADIIVTFAAAIAAYVTATRVLLGTECWQVLNKALRGHGSDYSTENQRGHWHRLLVDLFIVSPLPVLLAFSASSTSMIAVACAVGIIAAHQISPVRNVRTILAADLLLRGAVAAWVVATLEPLWLVPLVAIDVTAFIRMRNVYDPVTRTLTTAFGMSR